ncbi:hypothetical protein NLU13_4029 [Sarocladium strictum]|uniref:Uncharacterized protein n=1 Tax=Sarocladium strictum TaxID=5046 RepID=A0AA39L8J4_SARSR|nr:hypothetical protein NLU13_4029 [Sarocladium strictum]
MLFNILVIPGLLVSSAAAAAIHKFDIPAACGVCDAFGAACVAACIAGGPADPLCDICAGPAIGTCLDCLSQN